MIKEEKLLKSSNEVHNISSDIIESTFGVYKDRKSPNTFYLFRHSGVGWKKARCPHCGKDFFCCQQEKAGQNQDMERLASIVFFEHKDKEDIDKRQDGIPETLTSPPRQVISKVKRVNYSLCTGLCGNAGIIVYIFS